jgi:exonuclease SbcD
VFCISGNHDSAERLNFLTDLLKSNQVNLAGVWPDIIRCEDEYGPYNIYLLPYKKSEELREILTSWEVDTTQRNILVAHAFVVGASVNVQCDSELISIGGADEIPASEFSKFDYVALGHLHTKQEVAPNVLYAGSPLMYSFSELGHPKGALIIEIKEKGQCNISMRELQPLHRLREIKGPLQELISMENVSQGDSQDYIRAILTNEEELMEPMKALRDAFPNVLRMDIENSRTAQNNKELSADEIENKSFFQLFGEFYEKQNNVSMSETEEEILEKMWKKVGGE